MVCNHKNLRIELTIIIFVYLPLNGFQMGIEKGAWWSALGDWWLLGLYKHSGGDG